MTKKSIDKELFPKAQEMMLAGMQPTDIVEKLSEEYYDKQQIRNALDRMILPDEMENLVKKKKLLSILGAVLLVINIAAYLYSDGWATPHNATESSIDNLMLLAESFFAMGFAMEYFFKKNRITFKSHIFGSAVFVLGNFVNLFSYMQAEVYLSMMQLAVWLPLLILHIKWLKEAKKES
jgi:hypothetical protein